MNALPPVATFLIIGACHEYQRHQDDAEAERIRREFEALIRAEITGIDLVVEEAGDDNQDACIRTRRSASR